MTDTPEPLAPHEVVHLAGNWNRIGSHLRQRCAWCGSVLIDQDLSAVAFPIEQAPPHDHPTGGVATWETGALVAHDGAAWWVVDPVPSEDYPGEFTLPPGSCGKLDPAVTI